jgi:hypothetical protein
MLEAAIHEAHRRRCRRPTRTVEPEMRRLLPPEFGMFVTRLPVLTGDLQGRARRA